MQSRTSTYITNLLQGPLFMRASYTIRMVLLLLSLSVPTVHATTVLEVTVEEMFRQSRLVFEGEVTEVQVRENSPGRIHTYVTFEIRDIIKGGYPGDSITLSFLGGTTDRQSVNVPGMQLPAANERGIYFVEDPGRRQVHPFYGWSQGHLVIKWDPHGIDRVLAENGRPVQGVERSPGRQINALSSGVARGLVTGDPADISRALTVREFSQALRALW